MRQWHHLQRKLRIAVYQRAKEILINVCTSQLRKETRQRTIDEIRVTNLLELYPEEMVRGTCGSHPLGEHGAAAHFKGEGNTGEQ